MGSGTGTTAAETGQLGTTGDTKNAEDTTTGSGSGSGVTGAAASAASAVGIGSGNQAAGGGVGSTTSSSAPSGTAGQTLETAKEKVQEVADAATKEVTSGADHHKPPQPADGKPKKLENETSIPTAGGERLGEKHWGESKIVPDRPEPRPSEAGISSDEGQPTREYPLVREREEEFAGSMLTQRLQSKPPTTLLRTPVVLQGHRVAARATTAGVEAAMAATARKRPR